MMNSNLMAWLAETVNGDSTNEIARRSGLTVSTVHRQRTSGDLSPEVVAKIARAYGVSVVDALVTHGLMRASDISTAAQLDALRDATDQQLVDEILRRLEGVADGDGGVFDGPVTPPTPLRSVNVDALDYDPELDAVAHESDGEPTDEQ